MPIAHRRPSVPPPGTAVRGYQQDGRLREFDGRQARIRSSGFLKVGAESWIGGGWLAAAF